MSAGEERVSNPFGAVVAQPTNASAIAVQQREYAEIQAAMVIAKKFPRDPIASMDRILNACARPSLAEEATYSYARGGSEITGPSIRLAEVMAMNWGNMGQGVIELSRVNGTSECMAYAWDLETNVREERRFQVRHWRDTKKGGYQITDERDIYELVSNMGSRRKRACILAVIPGDVREAALQQCELTLKTKVEVTPESNKKLLEAFAAFQVTQQMIETKIQRRLDSILPAQVLQLRRIFTSLKDGIGQVADYFEVAEQAVTGSTATTQTEALKEKLRGKGKPATKPESDAIPHFGKDSAIAELQKSTDPDGVWSAIVDDYTHTGREVEKEVAEAYTARKAELAK